MAIRPGPLWTVDFAVDEHQRVLIATFAGLKSQASCKTASSAAASSAIKPRAWQVPGSPHDKTWSAIGAPNRCAVIPSNIDLNYTITLHHETPRFQDTTIGLPNKRGGTQPPGDQEVPYERARIFVFSASLPSLRLVSPPSARLI